MTRVVRVAGGGVGVMGALADEIERDEADVREQMRNMTKRGIK
jgi:hypothetical protein